MKAKFVRCSKRCFSLVLSFSLIFGLIGCSPSNVQPDDTGFDVTASPDAEGLDVSAPEDTRISDNGQPIYDFDEFVNGEWYKNSDKEEGSTYFWESQEDLYDRMKDILENTDISTLDSESGLYKVIVTYRGLMDTSDTEERMETIKNYIEPIESVRSLNDLYALYSIEDYARINYILNFNIKPDNYGFLVSSLFPVSRRENIGYLYSALNNGDSENGFKQCLYDLGYDDTKIEKIFDNALIVCDKIESYLEIYEDDTLWFYPHDEFPGSQINAPVLDILNSLDGLGDRGQFLADISSSDFLNELYVPENLEILKDFLLVSAFWIMPFSGYENFPEIYDYSYDDFVFNLCMRNASDILADEYMKRYCDDEDFKDVNSIVLTVKTASIKLLGGVDWLGEGVKEAAKQKISRMGQFIGQNGHRNLLTDYEPGDDVISNILALTSIDKHFERIQTYYYGSSRAPFGYDIINNSPYYCAEVNFLCVTPVMMCDPMFTETGSYEEQLAYFGFFVAHEIAHSSDSFGVEWDSEGTKTFIFGDESYEDYNNMLYDIIDYFDGKDTYYGRKYTGATVYNEAYADLCAMRVCLNILSEKEDADYDLFFRTYATSMRGYYVESDMDRLLSDSHLMSKERINFILGQFDEFYETYNIDESSPYFVPENERLRIF